MVVTAGLSFWLDTPFLTTAPRRVEDRLNFYELMDNRANGAIPDIHEDTLAHNTRTQAVSSSRRRGK
jgi:hypothetical protein